MLRGMTRREFLGLLAAGSAGVRVAHAQQSGGMASRGVRPQPRGKPSGLPFHARFTDVAARAGLRAPVIYGSPDRMDYILESMGCGVAFLDYDNDGWLDIFLLSGTRREGPVEGATNRLYKNNRDGTFTDVTAKAGLVRQGWACGVTVGDYNNDGFEDLFITAWPQNVLYRNNGDGTFTDVTRAAGLLPPGNRWGTGCTWVDYDRDGRLDLFVSNYLVFEFDKIPAAGKDPSCNFKGVPVNCGPRGLVAERPILYHNNEDGTFTDVTARAGIGTVPLAFGLTAVAADLDGDGWQDIYVACDSTPSLLFRNRGDGTFVEQGLLSGLAVNEDGNEQAGMGIAIGDFDTDVPRNDTLMAYWDTVADRLFKIRNSLTIEGVFRQLPLFDPPIDPAMLARAAVAGLDVAAVVSGLNQPLPLVRFRVLAARASEICQEVKSLGGQLLSAIEKKDAENLALLRSRQERVVLELAELHAGALVPGHGVAASADRLRDPQAPARLRRAPLGHRLIAGCVCRVQLHHRRGRRHRRDQRLRSRLDVGRVHRLAARAHRALTSRLDGAARSAVSVGTAAPAR